MLDCLNKVVNRIDTFQEDCAKMIFAVRHLLGEDQVINENDFILKQEDQDYLIYKNNEHVLTFNEEGTYAQPKFSRNSKLIKEAVKFLKRSISEEGRPDKGVEGQQLGGMPTDSIGEEDADLRSKVEKFLKQFPNPQDNMVHGLAKKLGVSPDKIEEVFYQIASEVVNHDEDEVNENSVADVSVNPNAFEDKPKKRKMVKEAQGDKVPVTTQIIKVGAGSKTGTVQQEKDGSPISTTLTNVGIKK